MKKLKRVLGTEAKLKTLLYLYNLKQNQKVQIGQIARSTGLSYWTLQRVLDDFMKAKIIIIMGATKGRYIRVANTKPRKVLWKFLDDFEDAYRIVLR